MFFFLNWVSTRTRPGITGPVSVGATMTTFNPGEGFALIKGIWTCAAATPDYDLEYGSISAHPTTDFTAASFAPGWGIDHDQG